MPNMDLEELFEGRRVFTEDQWIDALLRSTGMEPANFEQRVKWHLLARMIPLVENNYNLAELGPRGTARAIFTKRSVRTAFWFLGGKRRSPICFTTWLGTKLDWLACGML